VPSESIPWIMPDEEELSILKLLRLILDFLFYGVIGNIGITLVGSKVKTDKGPPPWTIGRDWFI
jgi:hypothetical protein